MIHMLSSFDLKPDEDWGEFTDAYAAFVDELQSAGVIVAAGPLGKRVSDTPMDTDDARDPQFHSILSFRDRTQLDAAYAYIGEKQQPGTTSHLSMYRRITNSIFLCWEDLPTV